MDITCVKCGKELEVPPALAGKQGQCPFCSEVFLCGPPPQAAAGLAANTSGQGEESKIPPEIMKWNWGAFWLALIWSIGNRVWIGLLTLVPVVNYVMPFVLGAKGNQMAWRSRKWESTEDFLRIQGIWAKWGWGVLAVGVVLGFVGGFLLVAAG